MTLNLIKLSLLFSLFFAGFPNDSHALSPPVAVAIDPSQKLILLKQERENFKDSFENNKLKIQKEIDEIYEPENKMTSLQLQKVAIEKAKKGTQFLYLMFALSVLLVSPLVYLFYLRKVKNNLLHAKDKKIREREQKAKVPIPHFLERASEQAEKITLTKYSELFDQICESVVIQKLYKDPSLSLSSLADILKSNPNYISKAIKQETDMNFNQYINEERIKEAQRMIYMRRESAHLPNIWEECGFSSRSTFYSAFQKFTGMTPVDFKKKSLQ
jgi:YesN/AraC family two-component response regulator